MTSKAFVDVYLNCVNVKGRQKGSWTGLLVGKNTGDRNGKKEETRVKRLFYNLLTVHHVMILGK